MGFFSLFISELGKSFNGFLEDGDDMCFEDFEVILYGNEVVVVVVFSYDLSN